MQSYDDRMAMIKKAAAKFNKKMKRNHNVRKSETSFMDKYDDGENINAYTDAPKYVDEYYGDRARGQSEYESYEGWN
jgi:hypothetical protein